MHIRYLPRIFSFTAKKVLESFKQSSFWNVSLAHYFFHTRSEAFCKFWDGENLALKNYKLNLQISEQVLTSNSV